MKKVFWTQDKEANSLINQSDEEIVIRSDSRNHHEESYMVMENEAEPSKNEYDEKDGNIELFQGKNNFHKKVKKGTDEKNTFVYKKIIRMKK